MLFFGKNNLFFYRSSYKSLLSLKSCWLNQLKYYNMTRGISSLGNRSYMPSNNLENHLGSQIYHRPESTIPNLGISSNNVNYGKGKLNELSADWNRLTDVYHFLMNPGNHDVLSSLSLGEFADVYSRIALRGDIVNGYPSKEMLDKLVNKAVLVNKSFRADPEGVRKYLTSSSVYCPEAMFKSCKFREENKELGSRFKGINYSSNDGLDESNQNPYTDEFSWDFGDPDGVKDW